MNQYVGRIGPDTDLLVGLAGFWIRAPQTALKRRHRMRWGRTPAAWAAQRTLTVIVELPGAPLLSVTVSLALKLPVLV